MSAAQITQLITAVCVAPVALLLGLLVTYGVANADRIRYKWRTRK